MTKPQRQKLITERADLQKLKKLYRKHMSYAVYNIKRCQARIVKIDKLLAE